MTGKRSQSIRRKKLIQQKPVQLSFEKVRAYSHTGETLLALCVRSQQRCSKYLAFKLVHLAFLALSEKVDAQQNLIVNGMRVLPGLVKWQATRKFNTGDNEDKVNLK